MFHQFSFHALSAFKNVLSKRNFRLCQAVSSNFHILIILWKDLEKKLYLTEHHTAIYKHYVKEKAPVSVMCSG